EDLRRSAWKTQDALSDHRGCLGGPVSHRSVSWVVKLVTRTRSTARLTMSDGASTATSRPLVPLSRGCPLVPDVARRGFPVQLIGSPGVHRRPALKEPGARRVETWSSTYCW